MTKADDYRKRAEIVTKSMKKRGPKSRPAMLKKRKALTDMAENEDWLDGKPNRPPKG
jgi:hypothetical protein